MLEGFLKKSSGMEESDISVQLEFSREAEPVEQTCEKLCYRNWLM